MMLRDQLAKKLFSKDLSPHWAWAVFVLNIAILVFLPFDSLLNLQTAWQSSEYSHGPLIPLVAGLIGWHHLVHRQPRISSSGWGCALLFAGIILIVVSQLSAFEPPAHYGFIVTLVGISLAYFGKDVTKTAAPAFIYLLFAVPLPRLLYVSLSAELQLWSSTLGVFMLRLAAIPVFQEGNVIDLGLYKLQVAEACSGLRYLFPLLSFSFLMAFLYDTRMWKRVLLFLSAIPITIVMNAARIAIVGVTVNTWGISMAEGVLHDFEGWVVFSLCVLILFGVMGVLQQVGGAKAPRGHFRYEYFSLARGPLFAGEFRLSMAALLFLTLSGLAALALAAGTLNNRQEITPPRLSFSAFPSQLGTWHLYGEAIDDQTLGVLQLDDYLLADAKRTEDGATVNVYMAYYKSQRVGSSIHSPANCLPGGGWRIEQTEIYPVNLAETVIPVSRLIIRKDAQTMLVYYWFAGRGRVLNEQYAAKWYLMVDSMTQHRTDGALVRLTTLVSSRETLTDADTRLQSFLKETYPLLPSYVP